jgi:tRNA-intron endonuclease
MEAIIEGKQAYTAYSKNLERRGFGTKKAGRIILHPVEVVYLASKRKFKVKMKGKILSIPELFSWAVAVDENFIPYYYAYEDLRRRGYKVRPLDEFLVGRHVFLPIAESKQIAIKEIAERRIENLILAVVDEENELTYYRVEEVDIKGRQVEDIGKIKGYLVKDRILTEDIEIFERFFYGSCKDDLANLSIMEGLYLTELGVLDVYHAGRRVSVEELRNIGGGFDPNFDRRYEVYKDLKSRGFVVKTGFKFGSDFRVYEEVRSVDDLPHSKFLITIVDDKKLPMFEVARAVRLAQNVRKKMIFVYKDTEGKNRYILLERVKV